MRKIKFLHLFGLFLILFVLLKYFICIILSKSIKDSVNISNQMQLVILMTEIINIFIVIKTEYNIKFDNSVYNYGDTKMVHDNQ